MKCVPWICQLYKKIRTVQEKNMNCTRKIFFWYNSYFFLVQFIFSGKIDRSREHTTCHFLKIWKQNTRKGYFFINKNNLFISSKFTILKGHEIIKNISYDFTKKNYFQFIWHQSQDLSEPFGLRTFLRCFFTFSDWNKM